MTAKRRRVPPQQVPPTATRVVLYRHDSPLRRDRPLRPDEIAQEWDATNRAIDRALWLRDT